MVERKIGERFPVNGRMIECVVESPMSFCRGKESNGCCFRDGYCLKHFKEIGHCASKKRKDGRSVCFIDVGPVPESMKIRYVENKEG